MKILLVNPIVDFFSPKESLFPYTSMGLLYLAAIAEKMGHEVKIKNCHYSNFKKIISKIKPDIVGITCYTIQYNQAKKIAEITKKYDKRIITIVGGHHPTFTWHKTLEETDVFDYICVGEGENTFKEFLENVSDRERIKKIKGLALKENEEIVFTGERELVLDLDSIPFPARHLINFSVPVIITSRGCFNNCKFCTIRSFYKNKHRRRNMGSIIDEILLLKNNGYKKIFIADDNFITDKESFFNFCDGIKKAGLDGIEFEVASDPRSLFDDDVLSSLEKINVRKIGVGIQSTIDEFREYLGLTSDYDFVKNFFEKIKKHNFDIWCFFIVNSGHRDEKMEQIKENIYKFCRLLASSGGKARFFTGLNILIPFPGTFIEKDFIKRGIKMDLSWSLYRFDFCTYEYNDVNEKNLVEIINGAQKKFFPFKKMLGDIKTMDFMRSVFLSNIDFFIKLKIISIFIFFVYFAGWSKHQTMRFICGKYL